VDFEDLMDVPEWNSYALFLREDFDEMETSSAGLFKNFLAGVKRVLMEIVEGVVSKECPASIKYMGQRLQKFLTVDRLDERDRDERGLCKKTSPAYVQACCIFRGVAAINVGIGWYLDNFSGTAEERNAVKSAIHEEMRTWGKMIASADITDPLIFGRQISAYSALWKYITDEPEMISMITKVYNLLNCADAGSPGDRSDVSTKFSA
jgi:Exportin-5 family